MERHGRRLILLFTILVLGGCVLCAIGVKLLLEGLGVI